MIYKVVFVRHGESKWTQKNLFCGWYDAALTDKGISEGIAAGKRLKEAGLQFDIAFTSQLSRAFDTLNIILKEIDQSDVPIRQSWKLNERHYGDLTGLNKEEAVKKYGFDQVHIWRRSYNISPPPMETSHQHYKSIEDYVIKMNGENTVTIPNVETLESTMDRIVPYWSENIVPELKNQKLVLVVSHGTCLRSLVKHIEGVSDEDIMNINIPQAIPFVYELDHEMKLVSPKVFLGDDEDVQKAIRKAASVTNKA